MVNTEGIPDAVVAEVESGIEKNSPDPARIGYVKEIREAVDADLPPSYNDDSDEIYYYELRAGDLDMGYDYIYYGLVYYYEDEDRASRRKLGKRSN